MNLEEGTVMAGLTPMKEGEAEVVQPLLCPTITATITMVPPHTCPTCQAINAQKVTHIDTMGEGELEEQPPYIITLAIMGVGPHSVKHWIPFMPSLLPNP